MPFNKIDVVLSGPELTTIQNSITALLETLPVSFNLTKEERVELQNISNERYPYVQRAIENHAPANPILVTGIAGTLAEAENDLAFYDQMENFIGQLKQVIEVYEDTQQVAGSEAYVWLREFYAASQRAAENQVPGSDAVVDDLATLFEDQGGGGSTPGDPSTP